MAGSGTAHLRPEGETLLRVEELVVEFPVGRSGLKVHAVSNVSLITPRATIASRVYGARTKALRQLPAAPSRAPVASLPSRTAMASSATRPP